jgi:hypothetical protein
MGKIVRESQEEKVGSNKPWKLLLRKVGESHSAR